MASQTTTTTVHAGHQSTITPSSSPDLVFLARLLPALDSLAADPASRLLGGGDDWLLAADAVFTTNANAPNPVATVLTQLARRGERLARFERDLHCAWDVAAAAAPPSSSSSQLRRTVLYESTSTTVFLGDALAREAKVREFSVLELRLKEGRSAGGGAGAGAEDWELVEIRTVMDPSPVTVLAQAIIASNKK